MGPWQLPESSQTCALLLWPLFRRVDIAGTKAGPPHPQTVAILVGGGENNELHIIVMVLL